MTWVLRDLLLGPAALYLSPISAEEVGQYMQQQQPFLRAMFVVHVADWGPECVCPPCLPLGSELMSLALRNGHTLPPGKRTTKEETSWTVNLTIRHRCLTAPSIRQDCALPCRRGSYTWGRGYNSGPAPAASGKCLSASSVRREDTIRTHHRLYVPVPEASEREDEGWRL